MKDVGRKKKRKGRATREAAGRNRKIGARFQLQNTALGIFNTRPKPGF